MCKRENILETLLARSASYPPEDEYEEFQNKVEIELLESNESIQVSNSKEGFHRKWVCIRYDYIL